jgi:hypothetical protein
VLGVLTAVLALVLYACSGSSSSKKNPGQGTKSSASPSALASAGAAAAAGGAAAGGVAAAGGGSGGGAGGSGSAAGGTGGSAGGTTVGGTTTGGSGTAGGTTSGTAGGTGGTTTGGTAVQGPCQLTLALTGGAAAYANGEQPSFTVAVVNKGTADCTADLGSKSLVLTVYSGSERIWSTADCGDGKPDLRSITAAGGIQQISVTWPRVHSSPGCAGDKTPATFGTYYAQVSLATGTGTTAASFTSSQQSFQLKSGS